MELDHDTIEGIKAALENHFVTRTECGSTAGKAYSRIEEIKVDTAKIETKLNMIVAILGVIGTAVCAAVVHIIFGG